MIYVVEDDKAIRNLVLYALSEKDYQVKGFEDGLDIVELVRKKSVDLLILDVMLPEKDGLEILKEIREFSSIPIIMLTARDGEYDKVMGLESGADDYITKPIDIAVTRAKIQAVLRRAYDYKIDSNILEFDNVYLDLSKVSISFEEESTILTRTELMILESLFESKGDIVMREDIIEKCWQGENFIDDNTLAVNITRLRKKLKQIGKADLIQTKKGMGYFLEASNE